MMPNTGMKSWIKPVAKAGLIAKGVVYCLLGVLTFMAAFEMGGQSEDHANKQGVFEVVRNEGGKPLLAILVLGLFCYSIWRLVLTFTDADENSGDKKGITKRLRYLFSALAYGSVAVVATKMLFDKDDNSGRSTTNNLSALLDKPWGQWAAGLLALIIAAVGIYQIYYGLSEKYTKHVRALKLHSGSSTLLLRAGKIGYVSRGIVWLLLAWLLLQATLHMNSNEAGNTAKAFQFLEKASYGSYLLGALGVGLICYGVFNFIRSRYETNF
jgi:hypothetical protein